MKTSSARLRRVIAAAALLFASLHAVPQWKAGAGIQTDFTAALTPGDLEDLRHAATEKKPYHLSKVGNNYSQEILIVTPFARAAEFVRRSESAGSPVTSEQVQKAAQPDRLTILMTSRFIDAEKARGALLVLKAGDAVVQPYHDEIISEFYKSVGFYAVPRYEVARSFDFDLKQLAGAPLLKAVIQQENGKTVEIAVDLGNLR